MYSQGFYLMGYVCRLGLYFCLGPNRRAKLPFWFDFYILPKRHKGGAAALQYRIYKKKGAASGCRDPTGKAITPQKIACGCWMAGKSGEPEERVALRSLEQVEGHESDWRTSVSCSSRINSM